MKPSKYIISGGGTGGHIYPAIAIADELKAQNPAATIIFVGALGKMEMEKVPQAGYKIHGIWISGLQRKQLWRNILFPLKLAISLLQSIFIWLRYRPDVLIGTGGFASGPMLFVGNLFGSKTLLQEQNSYPGITNKLLAKKANAIAVAYPEMQRFFPAHKIIYTGNPVRSSLINTNDLTPKAEQHFELSKDRKTLVVLGGSLGAQRINELIAANIDYFEKLELDVIWQCGKLYYDRFKNLSTSNIKIYPFIKAMDLLYAAADIIISRAGAASVSELCLVGKPTILVPSPNVSEDHQTKNAMALVNHKAAKLVKDVDAPEVLGNEVVELINDNDKLTKLSVNIIGFGRPNAAETIANEVIKLIINK